MKRFVLALTLAGFGFSTLVWAQGGDPNYGKPKRGVRLQPGLTIADGEARLRRCSALELWFGVILLGLTAVLVALPFPEGRM